MIRAGTDKAFDSLLETEDDALFDPEQILLATGKWKRIGAKIYFYVCRWFDAKDDDGIPRCKHGGRVEAIHYPTCLGCKEFDPLW